MRPDEKKGPRGPLPKSCTSFKEPATPPQRPLRLVFEAERAAERQKATQFGSSTVPANLPEPGEARG